MKRKKTSKKKHPIKPKGFYSQIIYYLKRIKIYNIIYGAIIIILSLGTYKATTAPYEIDYKIFINDIEIKNGDNVIIQYLYPPSAIKQNSNFCELPIQILNYGKNIMENISLEIKNSEQLLIKKDIVFHPTATANNKKSKYLNTIFYNKLFSNEDGSNYNLERKRFILNNYEYINYEIKHINPDIIQFFTEKISFNPLALSQSAPKEYGEILNPIDIISFNINLTHARSKKSFSALITISMMKMNDLDELANFIEEYGQSILLPYSSPSKTKKDIVIIPEFKTDSTTKNFIIQKTNGYLLEYTDNIFSRHIKIYDKNKELHNTYKLKKLNKEIKEHEQKLKQLYK